MVRSGFVKPNRRIIIIFYDRPSVLSSLPTCKEGEVKGEGRGTWQAPATHARWRRQQHPVGKRIVRKCSIQNKKRGGKVHQQH